MATEITALVGDIATLQVDAIVNAANTTLLGGGGVDGSIHYAAGPELLEECRRLGGCPTGESRITLGYQLPAKRIIHTVGPVWKGGTRGEPKLLASCYTSSLRLALEHQLATVAFPSISTGAYSYPLEMAAPIAVATVREFVVTHEGLHQVTFCCYTREDYAIYRKLLGLGKFSRHDPA
jgi:O-acetyl-ADP-ribose deacetylase (regulator of RNase III)